ncbi:MAG: hypothetical protein GY720_15425 [bacterium]|nr:hypothetical protein [bacterium]
MARPPYWRWLGAAAVIVLAAYMDLSGPATEQYPFVASDANIGELPEIEWREIPVGVLPTYGDLTGVAGSRLDAGTPLSRGLLVPLDAVPADWWSMPADLPPQATVGSRVLIAMFNPEMEVEGVVVAAASASTFGGHSPGLLAVPPQHAAAVAAALSQHRATLLIRRG